MRGIRGDVRGSGGRGGRWDSSGREDGGGGRVDGVDSGSRGWVIAIVVVGVVVEVVGVIVVIGVVVVVRVGVSAMVVRDGRYEGGRGDKGDTDDHGGGRIYRSKK